MLSSLATMLLPVRKFELVLFILRLVQPATIIAIVLTSILLKPTTSLLVFIFAPNPSTISSATTRYGTSINAGARTSSSATQPLLSASSGPPEPTPVIVPVRSRRRILTYTAIVGLAATYFLSGAFIVLRAVIPPRRWTPDSPRWQAVEWQALLGLIAWSSVAIACAYEETMRSVGAYGRGKVAWSVLLGFGLDVPILVLYALTKAHPIEDLPKSQLWVVGQLACIAVRVLLLYPLLAIALRWDQTRFVRAAELRDQQEQQGSGGEGSTSTENTSLLHTGRAGAPGYGATQNKANGTSGPGSGSHTPSNTASTANADMGLTVTATPPPPSFNVFFQRIRVLFPYIWPSQSVHLQLLSVFCVGLLITGRFVNFFVPQTLGKIVEDLAEQRAPWGHIVLYAMLKMLQGSGGLLSVLQAMAWLPIEQFSDRSLSLMAFDHLLHLSMAFHTRRKTGEVLRILDRGAVISSFFQYLIFNVVPIFVDIAVAMVYLGSTFGIVVGLAIFAVMYLYTYVSITLTTWRTTLRRQANNKDSISRAIHADVLINYELVKVHSNEPYELDRYRTALLDYQEADYRVTASLNLLNFVQNSIITAGTLITCLFVAHSVVYGPRTSSQFVVFITYLQQVYVPLGFLGTLHRVLMQNLVDTDKLMSLLEEESDVRDVPGAKDLVITKGIIEFRDVVFSYDGKVDALKGLNFTVNAKENAALVGESGAGKSSIMRLLYRFYDIQQGQILIDGQDISKVKQASLRKAIGIVPQEPSLFNTSIYQNILYGDTEATEEQVFAAAKAAQIYDRIMSFPDKWKTVVGERGVKLSGGEKQRVALARTFLKNPTILLLDEATSALDSHTEKLLQVALKTIMQGRTSLTIAHRLSTIINCDRIVVLDNGRVIENGSHGDLVQKGGLYSSMWMQQIKTEEEAMEMAKEEEEEAANADAAGGDAAGKQQKKKTKQRSASVEQKGLLGIVPPLHSPTEEGGEDLSNSPTQLLKQSGHESLVRDASAKDLLQAKAAPEADASTSKPEQMTEITEVPADSTTAVEGKTIDAAPSTEAPAAVSTSDKKELAATPVLFPSQDGSNKDKLAPTSGKTATPAPLKRQSSIGKGPAPSAVAAAESGTSTPTKESLRRRITSLIHRRSPSTSSTTGASGPVLTSASGTASGDSRTDKSLIESVTPETVETKSALKGQAQQAQGTDKIAAGTTGTNTATTTTTTSTAASTASNKDSPTAGLLKPSEAHQRSRSASTTSQASTEAGAAGGTSAGGAKKKKNRRRKKSTSGSKK